jgi:hypothetical protein
MDPLMLLKHLIAQSQGGVNTTGRAEAATTSGEEIPSMASDAVTLNSVQGREVVANA